MEINQWLNYPENEYAAKRVLHMIESKHASKKGNISSFWRIQTVRSKAFNQHQVYPKHNSLAPFPKHVFIRLRTTFIFPLIGLLIAAWNLSPRSSLGAPARGSASPARSSLMNASVNLWYICKLGSCQITSENKCCIIKCFGTCFTTKSLESAHSAIYIFFYKSSCFIKV